MVALVVCRIVVSVVLSLLVASVFVSLLRACVVSIIVGCIWLLSPWSCWIGSWRDRRVWVG